MVIIIFYLSQIHTFNNNLNDKDLITSYFAPTQLSTLHVLTNNIEHMSSL